jgi:hypothetical protein
VNRGKPMKGNRFLVMFMIILLSIQSIPVMGEQLIYDHRLNYDIEVRTGMGSYHVFYSNYSNQFYAFWGTDKNGILGYDYITVYAQSYDGITWTNYTYLETFEGIGAIEFYGTENQDFWLEPSGKHFWYVNMNNEDGHPYVLDYRVYNISIGGDIDLWIEELNIDDGISAPLRPNNNINICVDNETRPYIAYEWWRTSDSSTMAFLMSGQYTNYSWINDNQTWTHWGITGGQGEGSGYYMELLPTGNGVNMGVGRGVKWLVHYDNAPLFDIAMDTDLLINYFDGNGWVVRGLAGLSMEDEEAQWDIRDFFMAYAGNVTMIVKQIEDLVTPDRKRLDIAFQEGNGTWRNRTALSFTINGDVRDDGQFRAYVAMDEGYDFVVAWSIEDPNGNRTLWYRKGNAQQIMTNSSWTWQTGIVEWQTVTATTGFDAIWYSSGFNQMLPYGVPMSISWQENTDDSIWHDYIFTETNGELIIPIHYNTSITNILGDDVNNDWVFMGERYYFTSYFTLGSTFELNFTDGYDIHSIRMKFNNETLLISTENDENDEFVSGLFFSDYTLIGTTQKVEWGWILDKNIVDSPSTNVSYSIYYEDLNITLSGNTGISFRIYNIGGIGSYDHNATRGWTGKMVGGDMFEIWNDGYFLDGEPTHIIADGLWRKLQHVHTTFSFWRERDYIGNYYSTVTSDDDKIYFGLEYYENGTWINIIEVRITVEVGGLVGHGGGNADSSYDVFNVTWWQDGTFIKQDMITVYNHGYSFVKDEPNNRTYNRLWLDLWFNKLNSSTVVGGRVGAYYNGMWEWNGNPFWFGYGDFQPFYYNGSSTSSLSYTTLKDASGNIRSCYGLEIIRFYDGINKTDDFLQHTWIIEDFQIFDVLLASDRMEGINTPVFVEAEDISMPKGGGFLQPLVNAITGITSMITKALFGTIKVLIGAMDSILVDVFNSPVTMSQMIDWVMIQGSFVSSWIVTVIEQTSVILTIFTSMITTILRVFSVVTNWIAWTLVYVVGFPIHFLMIMLSAFQGTSYTVGAFTFDFTNYAELTSSIIQFAPYTIGFLFTAWFVFGDVDMRGEDFEGMPKRTVPVFRWFKEIYSDVFWIFSTMQNKVIELYNFIRSHIPAIGGSGGKSE